MWPLISVTGSFFVVLFMNEDKNLTNVVIGKLGKPIHKQNCPHEFFKFLKLLHRYCTS